MDFAYKYPFSNEAKQIISEQKIEPDNIKYLNIGKLRVEEALKNQKILYQNIEYKKAKLDFVIGYVFARIIVSALKNYYFLDIYIDAETKRSIEAMQNEDDNNLIYLAKQLNLDICLKNINGERLFHLSFIDLLKNNKENKLNLVNLKLSRGYVYLNKMDFLLFFNTPIKKAIKNNLPIPSKNISKQAFEYSKQIKNIELEIKQNEPKTSEQYLWIEKLINVPIPDVRHRIVNLILAPYFVNIRNFDEQKAFEIISQYIEKCKQLESNTKINDTYIRYQCKYAKNKKLKPLSFERARELLNSVLNLEDLVN